MNAAAPQLNEAFLALLLAPIPGEQIAGEDLAYAPELDEIREARREDDPTLAQGEWEAPLKVAEWPRVAALCDAVLRNKSKDLQVAAWYAEALTKLHGFAGLAFGLRVLDGLITDFWEFAWPEFDPADLDARAGIVEWLDAQLAQAVRHIPLTSRVAGGYSWLKWDESRQVENLGLKDPEARQKALDEGKLPGEAFDKAAAASGARFYEDLMRQTREAAAALDRFVQDVDEKFGADAPSLKTLRQAVEDCDALVSRLAARLGGRTSAAQPEQPSLPEKTMQAQDTRPVSRAATVALAGINSRDEAVEALRTVARWFRANEPHSPVALLAERAARWAEMPLEAWLASVIKDEATLNHLRELLDVRDAG